jgi:transposase
VASLQVELIAVRAELATVRAENVELRARLGKTLQNSSKPPSSDPPGARPRPKQKNKKRRARKRGAQPGHKANFAAVPAHVDEVHPHRPMVCEHCDADLGRGKLTGSSVSHFVYELPEIRPIVHEHRCLDIECARCGLVTPAALPAGVPTGDYGPSVQAMTALLRGELKQSVRQTSAVMTHVMHVPMSTGMVAKTQAKVSAALGASFVEALGHAQGADRANADETSWPVDKKMAWLWVMVAGLVTVFRAGVSRGAETARDLVGESFGGVLITDRYSSYGWIATNMRQLCWSHLTRDFKSFLDYGVDARRVGEQLLCETRRMFRAWHKVRDGTMGRGQFQLWMRPVRRRILALLEAGRCLPIPKVSGMCKHILKLQDALFTFVDLERVEPTNNAAERALRFSVLWRKGSFGSDSKGGCQFVERFLTVRATLRSQNRDLYEFLREACAAALIGAIAPSLLPAGAADGSDIPAAA